MIALSKKQNAKSLQSKFTDLLPTIQAQLRFAFRHEPPERKEDMIAEAIANCWVAFVKLVERGLEDAIYATPLAQFAIRQAYDGRKVVGCDVKVISMGPRGKKTSQPGPRPDQ